MLIVDDDTFSKETSKLVPSGKVISLHRGNRGLGRLEVPQSLRQIIAEEAILGTPAKQISQTFGISPSSIAAYKVGATSCATYNKPDPELAKANSDLIYDVTNSARSKLTLALEHITSDKIASAKLGTISQVAKDMSAIVKNLEPSAQSITNNNQVIVYRPKQKEEDDFEVITVSE